MAGALLILLLLWVAVWLAAGLLGTRRWEAGTRALRARLEARRAPLRPANVAFADLAGLPAPVRGYLRAALTDGQRRVTGAWVRHAGTFNLGEARDRWTPFTSDQVVVVHRPGFDWDGRMAPLPGLTVRVHDAYVAGEGLLRASLLGLVPLADLHGPGEVAEGELMRFLAEAVWYPTALLPGQGVAWEPVDDRSARATLTDGDLAVTLRFGFDASGLIETVRAEARARLVAGRMVPTPWEGRFRAYEVRDGMRVPLEGEVAWLLPTGPKPYWRGRITAIAYRFAG